MPDKSRRIAPHSLLVIFIFAALLLLVGACSPLAEPPRLATATARAGVTPGPVQSEAIVVPAPTATGEPTIIQSETPLAATLRTLVIWGKAGTRAEENVQREIAREFGEREGVQVELLLVEPELLPDLMHNAVVSPSFTIPDVALLPLEYSVGWAEEGILNPAVAGEVITALDAETFAPSALEPVMSEVGPVAVPSDGWPQLLLYRQDWFSERGLAPPLSYTTMITAGNVISDRTALIAGFNIPTESSLVATTRVFEQMALANGCRLTDAKGELQILEPECQEALEFYRFMCNSYCPPGVQTEVSALTSYLEGRAGMIMAPPSALPVLAGLDVEARPSCPDCRTGDYLARNTAIVTSISGAGGLGQPVSLGNMSYLAATTEADPELARQYMQYWFEEGYERWLASRPEMKIPLRLGDTEESEAYLEAWYDLPLSGSELTLAQLYGEAAISGMVTALFAGERWGFPQGQGSLMSTVYEELLFSVLLQELLSGYYNSERAAIEGYKRLADAIPDYPYYVDPEPTPTPES